MKNSRLKLVELMHQHDYDPIGLDFTKLHRKIYIDGVDHYDVKEMITITYTENFYKVRRYYLIKKEIIPDLVPPQLLLEITDIIVKGGMIMLNQ